MTALRYCEDGGLIVGATCRLPTDASEYNIGATAVPYGCNRMRCSRCDEIARAGPPGRGEPSGRTLNPSELFAAESWDDLTEYSEDVRLYACRCAVWEAGWGAISIDHKREFANDPHMDWACAGHPVPELPVHLGELIVAADTDWAALVDKILLGTCPRPLELVNRTDGPALWLGWLYVYLSGLPAADALSAALAERLSDPDLLVRGRVLYFFGRFPLAVGLERLVMEADWAPQLLAAACPIPEWHKPLILFDAILARLEVAPRRTDAVSARAEKVLRHAMLAPPAAPGGIDIVAKALESFSVELWNEESRLWLADNAAAIDAAGPGRWRGLMDLLADRYRKPALGYLIVIAGMALIQQRGITAADFRAWLEGARTRGVWVDDAWVLPLQALFEDDATQTVTA